jgi:hypothetical protein
VCDANVVKLLQPGSFADPLTEVLRNGARALLAKAIGEQGGKRLLGIAGRDALQVEISTSRLRERRA